MRSGFPRTRGDRPIYALMYNEAYGNAWDEAREQAMTYEAVDAVADRAGTYIAGRTIARILNW